MIYAVLTSVQERESLIAAADERVTALEDEKEGIPLPYLTFTDFQLPFQK